MADVPREASGRNDFTRDISHPGRASSICGGFRLPDASALSPEESRRGHPQFKLNGQKRGWITVDKRSL